MCDLIISLEQYLACQEIRHFMTMIIGLSSRTKGRTAMTKLVVHSASVRRAKVTRWRSQAHSSKVWCLPDVWASSRRQKRKTCRIEGYTITSCKVQTDKLEILLSPDLQLLTSTPWEVIVLQCMVKILADNFTSRIYSFWREAYHMQKDLQNLVTGLFKLGKQCSRKMDDSGNLSLP